MWAPEPTAGSVTEPILVSCMSGPDPTFLHNTLEVFLEHLTENQCHYYDTLNI